MKIRITETVALEASKLVLHLAVGNRFCARLTDYDGTQVGRTYAGVVPEFMPGLHGGEFVMLHIALETGHVLNWHEPTVEQLTAIFVPAVSENLDAMGQ